MAGNCSTHGAREQANYIIAGERHLGVEKKGSHRLPKWVTGLFLSGVLWAWHILHYLRMICDHSLEMPPKCPRSLMGVCVPPQLTVDTWNLPFLFSFISRAKKMMLTQTTLSVGNGRIKAEQHGWNTDAEMAFPVTHVHSMQPLLRLCSQSRLTGLFSWKSLQLFPKDKSFFFLSLSFILR